NRIVVGHHTNIQDNAVLHLADDYPCVVGDYVTVGHSAIVHACTVGDEVLIGMGAIILDGAVIGERSLIGANALVTQGKGIPPESLVLGSPAKVVRALTVAEREQLRISAEKYAANAAYCLKNRISPHRQSDSRALIVGARFTKEAQRVQRNAHFPPMPSSAILVQSAARMSLI